MDNFSERVRGIVGLRPVERYRAAQSAFTLVELLVVIAIIGILVALLLPAVQSAREAARRAQCQSQIKNVALAMLNYESTNGRFPPAIVSPPPSGSIGNSRDFSSGWSIEILPFMEEQPTFDSFNRNQPIAGGTLEAGPSQPNWANIQTRGTNISVFKCPSEPNSEVPYAGGTAAIPAGARSAWGDNWARGNYAANVGAGQMANAGSGIVTPPVNTPRAPAWSGRSNPPTWPSAFWPQTVRGIVGPQEGVRIAQVVDGLSKTMMLAEVRSGINEGDPRGTWALPHAGASLVAAHGSGGDANGPNYCGPSADDMPLNAIIGLNTFASTLTQECMTFNQDPFGFAQGTSRSQHPGGVMMAYADGGVTFLQDDIETTGEFGSCCAVWDHLIMAADELFGL